MAKKQIDSWLATSVQKLARVHFFYILAHAGSIIIFDSWNLLTPEDIRRRWTMVVIMLVVNTILWYLSRNKVSSEVYYKLIALGLIVLDIGVAAYLVYVERGIASRGVMLFALPIIISAVLQSRRALYAVASFSTAAYILAVMRYSTEHFGENYKIELYGVMAFYTAIFFILAALLRTLIRPRV